MRRRQLADAARWRANHQWHACLTTEHVVNLRGVIDDLVNRYQDEVDGHNLDHWAQTQHRRAGRQTDKALLGDWRIDHALFAEFALQALGDPVGTLELADLLTHQHHIRVTR